MSAYCLYIADCMQVKKRQKFKRRVITSTGDTGKPQVGLSIAHNEMRLFQSDSWMQRYVCVWLTVLNFGVNYRRSLMIWPISKAC